jgi:dihydrofolate synthase/folylpolyglutamate synthase
LTSRPVTADILCMSRPHSTSTLEQRLAPLYARRAFGIKPGLDVIRGLLAELGNPQESLGVIHLAGTNGKGSTAIMIEAGLRAMGLAPVGLYTSPHLLRFNERIRVDGIPVADDPLVALFDRVDTADRTCVAAGAVPATFFEFTTAMAFLLFREQGVKLAVIETGLGGRLDATNVVTPLVSVITRIGLDHQSWLGNSLEEIAAEKCGIIKSGRPVVMSLQEAPAAEVVVLTARAQGSPLVDVAAVVSIAFRRRGLDEQQVLCETASSAYGVVHLPLVGDHQGENLATAVATLDVLSEMIGLPLDPARVKQGLASLSWPGRCQLLARDPLILADAAHNPPGAAALSRTLKQLGHRKVVGIMGCSDDKDADGIVQGMAGRCSRLYTVAAPPPRGMAAERLATVAEARGLVAQPCATYAEALTAARRDATASDQPVVIFGTIFILSPFYDLLGVEL